MIELIFAIVIIWWVLRALTGGNKNNPSTRLPSQIKPARRGSDADIYFLNSQLARSQGDRNAGQFFMLGMFDSLSVPEEEPEYGDDWAGYPEDDEQY